MNRISLGSVAMLLLSAPLYAQPGTITRETLPPSLTLEDAITFALRNNGAYLRAANDSAVDEAARRNAFSRMLPVPGGSFSTTASPSRSSNPSGTSTSSSSNTSVGLNLSLNVFDGGASLNNYRQSRIQVQRGRIEHTNQEQQLRANVINQYYRAQLADSGVALELRVLAARKQELEVTEVKFLEALVSPLERQRAMEAVLRAENAVLNARDALVRARLDLIGALGVSAGTDFSLATPIPTFGDSIQLNADSIAQLALEANPNLKLQRLTLDVTRMNNRYTRNSRFMPNVRLSGSFSRSIGGSGYSSFFDPTGRNTGMSASLGVQYSFSQLLDFTSTSFRLKSSNAQLEDQEISMREASINTDRQARQAVLDLQAAYRQLAFTRRLLEGIRLQVQVANDQLGANLISYFNHQQVMDGASAAERDLLNQQLNVLNRTIALDLLLGNRPGG